MDIDYYERIVERIQLNSTQVMVSSATCFVIGFLQYAYATRLQVREGLGPITFWMQSLYVAHELKFVYLFSQAAPRYDYHWFLAGAAFSLSVIHNPKDRVATFSCLFGRQASISSILSYVSWFQLAILAFFWSLIQFMGPGCFLLTGALTNVLMIIGSTHEYLARGSRSGISLDFSLTNVACAVWTFAPFSMRVAVLLEIFDQPVMHAAGFTLLGYSVWLMTVVAVYPPKTGKKGQPSPIW